MSIISAALDLVAHGTAPKETQLARTKICLSCDKLDFGLFTRCRECGCVIAGKVASRVETCPDGKWGPFHP